MDLKINVEAEEKAEETSVRLGVNPELEMLKPQVEPSGLDKGKKGDDVKAFIHLELNEAASRGTYDHFLQVLSSVSEERNEPASTIVQRARVVGNSVLHAAARAGNQDVASFVAESFPLIIPDANHKGDTALHIAARRGMLSLVRVLVNNVESGQQKQFLETQNAHGNTALHEAVMNRHVSVAKYFLIEQQMEPNCSENKEGLYLLDIAIKNDDFPMVEFLLKNIHSKWQNIENFKGNSPAHTAIWEGRIGMLKLMVEKYSEFIELKDGIGRTTYSLAASIDDMEAVRLLLSHSTESWFELDRSGFLPIHAAAEDGCVEAVKELLKIDRCPDPVELLAKNGENILHSAAKFGRDNVVRYVLGNPRLVKLLNQKDENGNTPLHMAAFNCQAAVVLTLTWDKRIQLNPHNNQGFTPLDLANRVKLVELSFQRQMLQPALTVTTLYSAGCKRRWDPLIQKKSSVLVNAEKKQEDEKIPPKFEWIKDNVGTLLTIATLVATGTFTASFTVPGGYNSSGNRNEGMPTLLDDHIFQFFLICNTTSFYCSIICIIFCLYTKYADTVVSSRAYGLSVQFFGVALLMMALAFISAVQLSVGNVSWLTFLTLIIGVIFLILLSLGLLINAFPHAWRNPFARFFSYYMFRILIFLFLKFDVREHFEGRLPPTTS